MSSYRIFIIIRFSINFEKKKWDLNALNYRFFLFENICLASLKKQKEKENLKVIILISNDLPKDYKEKLNNLLKDLTFIKVEIFKSFKLECLQKYITEEVKIVATVRLDDDDALHPNFTSTISKYCESKYANCIISFPNGAFLRLEKDKIKYKLTKKNLIAAGLTMICSIPLGKNIYNGNHTKWQERGYKCIFDPKYLMFIVSDHNLGQNNRFQRGSEGFKDIDAWFNKKVNFIELDKLLKK